MDMRKDLPDKIYHYTSLGALCSIVENQEFWLGDSRQMNDYNEALELLKPLNTLLNQDNDLYGKEDNVNIITKRAKDALTKTPIYIANFTTLMMMLLSGNAMLKTPLVFLLSLIYSNFKSSCSSTHKC